MPDTVTWSHLREFILFLVIAGIIIPLFRYFKISSILGYLIIGMVIGPYALGALVADYNWLHFFVISDVKNVHFLGELGVIFLLFIIGLELSPDRLWKMRRLIFGLGTLQVIISAIVIGFTAWFFGNNVDVSIILGICLALSSTAIVMQWLSEKRQLGTPLGRVSISILLLQDLMVIPILFLLTVFDQRDGSQPISQALIIALFKAIAAIIVISLIGRYWFRPLFRFVGSFRSAEMFIALTILIIIGMATIAQLAGMSMALGAFLAGLLLAETEYCHEIESYIDPFKGLLLGLFFISVGMGIDYHVLLQDPFWIIASVFGLFFIKAIIITGLTMLFRTPRHIAIQTGFLLGQGGEFGFLVVGITVTMGVMPLGVAQFMLIVVGLTMLMTSPSAFVAQKISRYLEPKIRHHKIPPETLPPELSGHVIIAGYGRIGKMLGDILEQETIPYLILEFDTHIVHRARREGKPIFYGNVTHKEVLERMGIDQASALALTINDPDAIEKIVHIVKTHWPALPIFVRARDVSQAIKLHQMGHAITAIPENLEASLELAGRLLKEIGVPSKTIKSYIEEQRDFEEAV